MNHFLDAAGRPRAAASFGAVFLDFIAAGLNRSGPVLALALGVFGLRLPSFSFDVLNVDESVYHLMGQAWLHGTAPHLGIVDNKPLGLYAIHALAGAIFSDPIAGARLLGAIATFAAAVLLMRLAERFLGLSRWGAATCGLLFATYAILLGGDASQGPVFYGPLLAGGAYLIMTEIAALNRGAAPSVAKLGFAGLLLGLSLQIKYVTVFECAAFGVFYLHAAWCADRRSGGAFRMRSLLGAAALVAGGLFPTIAVIAAYAAAGEGGTFVFYTFVANATRAMNQDPPRVILGRVGLILFAMAPLMAPGLEYLRVPAHAARPRWVKLFLAAWFASAMMGGIAQLQFYDHYFYEAMLPLAVMAAAALFGAGAAGLSARERGARFFRRSGTVAAVMLLGMAVVGYIGVRAAGVNYNGPRNMPSIVARDIRAVGARSMYVFNGHTLLHLLTGIPLPTRYPLADHLLRDINADMFGFNAHSEMARVLDGDQDVVVVHRPINPTVSADRKKLLEDKLSADYCLWRRYPSGAHEVDVYLLNEFSGHAACAAPQQVAGRAAPRTRSFPRQRKAAHRVLVAGDVPP